MLPIVVPGVAKIASIQLEVQSLLLEVGTKYSERNKFERESVEKDNDVTNKGNTLTREANERNNSLQTENVGSFQVLT